MTRPGGYPPPPPRRGVSLAPVDVEHAQGKKLACEQRRVAPPRHRRDCVVGARRGTQQSFRLTAGMILLTVRQRHFGGDRETLRRSSKRGFTMSYKALAFGAALAIGVSSAATAGQNGNTVSANYDWPTLGTVLYASGTAVVGPGVEFDNIGGFGVGLSPTVDFSDSNILVTYPGGWLLAGTGSFDGWVFTDYTKSDIIGVSLAGTNLPGFTAADLSFDFELTYMPIRLA